MRKIIAVVRKQIVRLRAVRPFQSIEILEYRRHRKMRLSERDHLDRSAMVGCPGCACLNASTEEVFDPVKDDGSVVNSIECDSQERE